LANQLGVHLGKIISFQESNGAYGGMLYKSLDVVANQSAAPAAPQIPAGQNKVTSNVTIVYEIK
jgi:uncharacterized protein YggE